MMLGIRAIQRVEGSARGDRKGYFRIAMQRRPPAAAKAIKHPGAAAQTPPAQARTHPGFIPWPSQQFGVAFWMGR